MPGIPYDRVRAAKRRVIEAQIAARPAALRFRDRALTCLNTSTTKTRAMELGGFTANYTTTILVALPLGSPPPQPEKEYLDLTDRSGETRAFTISGVEPDEGLDCYTLFLRVRQTRPTRSAIPGVARPPL